MQVVVMYMQNLPMSIFVLEYPYTPILFIRPIPRLAGLVRGQRRSTRNKNVRQALDSHKLVIAQSSDNLGCNP